MPVLRIGAAALAAAVVLCTFPGCASDIEEADATERILLFSGVDLSRTSGFLFGGFVWSPHGINAGGFAMKTLAGGGVYRYRSGAQQIIGRQVLNSVMPYSFTTRVAGIPSCRSNSTGPYGNGPNCSTFAPTCSCRSRSSSPHRSDRCADSP